MASSGTATLSNDVEKGIILLSDNSQFKDSNGTIASRLQRWNAKIESLAGLESRGIARVLPEERHRQSLVGYLQMALLWFSANLTANNIAVGFLVLVAYMSTWGAQSGSRTLVVARYFMGYWPSKICVLLNIVVMIGYGTIDCIISGQILSAVSGGNTSVVIGIIIVAVISWLIAVFGMAIFHHYERWAWIPQLSVLLILIGCAGPNFNPALPSIGDQSTIIANRITFFSLTFSVSVSWAGSASDFFVYYPESTAKWKTFLMTLVGLTLAFSFTNVLGTGIASGMASNEDWAIAFNVSSGAVILAGYNGLGGFGKFCGVVAALGLIQNNIPGTYSAALGFQMLGRYPRAVPRWVWTSVVVVIYLICALVGREQLFAIFQNFLALMGYWVTTFISIALEEHLLFRRNIGFDWSAWEDQRRLPIGYAALTAFLFGWCGAIVSMCQVYFVGPVARLVGNDGADLGIFVGSAFSLLTYPSLRLLELKLVGR